MGKKSRRQRTKKVLTDAPPPAIKHVGELAPEELRGFGNELLDCTHGDERGSCRLIDALQRCDAGDAGPFSCRCALPAVRRDDTGVVAAAQLVDDTAQVDVLVPLWACRRPLLGLRKAI